MDGWGEAGIIFAGVSALAAVVGVGYTVLRDRQKPEPVGGLEVEMRAKPRLVITAVDAPGGMSSGGEDDTFMFPVHVSNEGSRTAGISVVMRGGGIELGRNGPFPIDSDEGTTWFLQVRHARVLHWRPRSSGWDYTGEGDLAVELQDAHGATLARFQMPRSAAM